MYYSYPKQTDSFLGASSGQIATYAHRGLGSTDYHNYRFGSHAAYNAYNLQQDLQDIINTIRPNHIVTVAAFDQHPDHATTAAAIKAAVVAVTTANPSYIPVIDNSLVWSTNPNAWPLPINPVTYFTSPPGLSGTGFTWASRESLDVPLSMQILNSTNLKTSALNDHVSQGGASNAFLAGFIHMDEFFWPVNYNGSDFPPLVNAGPGQTVMQGASVTLNGSASSDKNKTPLSYSWTQVSGPSVTLKNPTTAKPSFTAPSGSPIAQALDFELKVSDGILNSLPDHIEVYVRSPSTPPPNVAPLATVTASSQNVATGQTAIKAVDGVAEGYPQSPTNEWATLGQGAGAWIELDWDSAYQIYQIILYDRPNLNDQVESATITFSNGSTLNVGALDNTGLGVTFNVNIPATNSMRVTITSVSGSTTNIGLSEIGVYALPAIGSYQPPVANAGPDQTVALGAAVSLNAGNSSDPAGNPIVSYSWTQTAGPTVTLTGANTATPSFTAPANLLTTLQFSLVVNDGTFNSTPDPVNVNITTLNSGVDIAPLASVTASSQNFNTDQLAVAAVDGVIAGFPCCPANEWATMGQGAGAWLLLSWSMPYQVSSVILYDRPNMNDQITGGTLTFSDGSQATVGVLDNAGAGLVINLPTPVITNSVLLTVTTVSGTTYNVGLAEIQVYGFPGATKLPVANAGVDQAVNPGAGVNLDGSQSVDPVATPLTYLWTQTAGPTITLIGANTATPSFIAPSGLAPNTVLTFALVVNDGQLNSAADSVNITIVAPTQLGTNIALNATATASSEDPWTTQLAIKAIDGIVNGYPGDYTKEWATIGGVAGSWIQLAWSTNYQINEVVLYDRPNLSDQITSATLTFGDGSNVTVGMLDNAGAGMVINLPVPIVTNSILLTVTSVSGSTQNVGLAEFMVYGQ
jgi:LmbE family N-acetylglucosaminyl deacetylase